MRVHMARWWYYGGSPRTTVGSFSLEIYLSELRRITSLKTRLPDLFSRPATSQMNEKKYLQSELILMPGIQPKVGVHYQQSEVFFHNLPTLTHLFFKTPNLVLIGRHKSFKRMPHLKTRIKQAQKKCLTIDIERDVFARETRSRSVGARYFTFSNLSKFVSFSCTSLAKNSLIAWGVL